MTPQASPGEETEAWRHPRPWPVIALVMDPGSLNLEHVSFTSGWLWWGTSHKCLCGASPALCHSQKTLPQQGPCFLAKLTLLPLPETECPEFKSFVPSF